MIVMEVGYCIRCCDVVVGHPHVFASVVALPLHQVFDAAISETTVQDMFDFILAFAVYEDRVGGRCGAMAWEGVCGCWCQLDDREHRVQATERDREA